MQGQDSVLVSENMYIYLNNLLCHHSCEYLFPWQILVTLNSPKSVITTLPFSRKMFFVFKSLWMIPLACK